MKPKRHCIQHCCTKSQFNFKKKEIFVIKFNRERLYDKIYACWIGKNIGGTMGTPYEGSRALNDISGFVTPPGEPLPNDDLDLQACLAARYG